MELDVEKAKELIDQKLAEEEEEEKVGAAGCRPPRGPQRCPGVDAGAAPGSQGSAAPPCPCRG